MNRDLCHIRWVERGAQLAFVEGVRYANGEDNRDSRVAACEYAESVVDAVKKTDDITDGDGFLPLPGSLPIRMKNGQFLDFTGVSAALVRRHKGLEPAVGKVTVDSDPCKGCGQDVPWEEVDDGWIGDSEADAIRSLQYNLDYCGPVPVTWSRNTGEHIDVTPAFGIHKKLK